MGHCIGDKSKASIDLQVQGATEWLEYMAWLREHSVSLSEVEEVGTSEPVRLSYVWITLCLMRDLLDRGDKEARSDGGVLETPGEVVVCE